MKPAKVQTIETGGYAITCPECQTFTQRFRSYFGLGPGPHTDRCPRCLRPYTVTFREETNEQDSQD